ncbi:unnamed protein product [Schistosoma margrebowiei]|uniref:Uncharacterized protein n=1 Tax=Schistosoma margrebowiei TaxID=48269 RepID=A0A3P7Z4J0_9TREM|nr:unnamed protein product [Schistosoma margrebowiei]
MVRTLANTILRSWIQTILVWYANSSNKHNTLLAPFYGKLEYQRLLPALPTLSSYNRTFADQSHKRNRYVSEV